MIENDKILWYGIRRQTNTKRFILLEIMTFMILSFSRTRQGKLYNDLYQLAMNTR